MSIRPERTSDAGAIHDILVASFPTADEARLVDALRAAGALRVSLVAEDEGKVVGHVAFSPVSLDGTSGGVGLAPLAVMPSHRRRGIGVELIRAGLAACERAGCGFVVLLGDPSYYSRCGFKAAARWKLSDEYNGGDAFQALELSPGAIPSGGGLVRYSAEFEAL